MNFSPLFFDPLELGPLALALLAVVLAYAAFSLLGFGSALLASPALVMVLPVARVVPLLAMLDAVGSIARGWRNRHLIAREALEILLPTMLLGQLLGVAALYCLPVRAMALLFGGFIVLLGLSSFLPQRVGSATMSGTSSALWHGIGGGILGGMFGSGGFMYARYLQALLPQRDAMRATQAVLIAVSTVWRVLLCAFAGLIDWHLVSTALLLAPIALIGFRLGKLLDGRLSQARWVMLLNAFLVLAGLALIFRHIR